MIDTREWHINTLCNKQYRPEIRHTLENSPERVKIRELSLYLDPAPLFDKLSTSLWYGGESLDLIKKVDPKILEIHIAFGPSAGLSSQSSLLKSIVAEIPHLSRLQEITIGGYNVERMVSIILDGCGGNIPIITLFGQKSTDNALKGFLRDWCETHNYSFSRAQEPHGWYGPFTLRYTLQSKNITLFEMMISSLESEI